MKNRPTTEDCLISTALIWGQRSTCPRSNASAIISKSGRIISIGYVGSPVSKPHCYEAGCLIEDEREGCIRGIHGEINAIGFAAQKGISTKDAQMITTLCPCLRCSQAILAAGIVRVVYVTEHRDMRGVEYLRSNGVEVVKYDKKVGE